MAHDICGGLSAGQLQPPLQLQRLPELNGPWPQTDLMRLADMVSRASMGQQDSQVHSPCRGSVLAEQCKCKWQWKLQAFGWGRNQRRYREHGEFREQGKSRSYYVGLLSAWLGMGNDA